MSFMLAAAEPPAREFVLSADDWARPRSGERVIELPAVRDAVRAWLAAPGAILVVSHPGGERGLLWASELHDWLVALGIPGERIELRPGSPREDAVLLWVDGG